ncbi:hypothetical protein Lal_00001770 [Lupinus albus]|nr:hypothetical protein Lal_00001770 [Lupinus albus]
MNLLDLPLLGRRYTWVKGDDWGPKPFQMINALFEDIDFVSFVEQQWVGLQIRGWKMFALKEKLGESTDLAKDEVLKRSNLWADLWQARLMQHNLLFHKSRSKWLTEGDSNSKLFHGLVNSRRRNNTIQGLRINGDWIEDVPEVTQGVHNHFQQLFSEGNLNRPTLRGIPFNRLGHSDNNFLTASFEEAQIKNVIWDFDSGESSGPDGKVLSAGLEMGLPLVSGMIIGLVVPNSSTGLDGSTISVLFRMVLF